MNGINTQLPLAFCYRCFEITFFVNALLDPTPLFHLSHTYCVAICAALVPLNVLATLQTLILVGLQRSIPSIRRSTCLAIAFALLMIMHVLTWLLSGVVMAPTYILLSLASICFLCNLWAIVYRHHLSQFLRLLWTVALGDRWPLSKIQIS